MLVITLTVVWLLIRWLLYCIFFFFQAEDGIRDLVRSRGLGDVYKRQLFDSGRPLVILPRKGAVRLPRRTLIAWDGTHVAALSLIHI